MAFPFLNRQDPKIKLTVYVSRIVAEQLDLVCNDRTKNKSKLTETALSQLLIPKATHEQDSALPRRLDRLAREVGIINRHQRFQRFVEQLGRRLASTATFANEITDQLASHAPKPSVPVPDGAKPPASEAAPKA